MTMKRQLTLGKFIIKLERAQIRTSSNSLKIWKPRGLTIETDEDGDVTIASFRGYYDHLALVRGHAISTAKISLVLEKARSCVGKSFEGWKGGTYLMGKDTPMWLSAWGSAENYMICNIKIKNDVAYLILKEEEWGTL